MAKRTVFLLLSSALAFTGCGQQQPQQHNTNPQYQTQNTPTNANLDCTPITNPNYVPGGNQTQYYYPEGCQSPNNMNNGNYNNGYNNGSNMGGYVAAAAVGAAAGALANRAYSDRNKGKTNINTTPNTTTYPRTQNTRTYTPTTNRNSSVYRSGKSTNRTTAKASSRRR